MLARQREMSYTIPELTAVMRATFQGTAGLSVPGNKEVEDLELDPMGAKFSHLLVYTLTLGKNLRIGGAPKNAWMKKKKIRFMQDRSVLDRLITGGMTIDHVIVYAKGPEGMKHFDLCPLDGTEVTRALFAALDKSYLEVLDAVTKQSLDEE